MTIPTAALAEQVIPAPKGGIILCREGGKVTKKIIVTIITSQLIQ
jgi:hypothetical protein